MFRCILVFFFLLFLQKRGQIWACLDDLSKANATLCKDQCEVKRQLLHLMLQGCIQDLKETGNVNMPNVVFLRIFNIYGFVALQV